METNNEGTSNGLVWAAKQVTGNISSLDKLDSTQNILRNWLKLYIHLYSTNMAIVYLFV